MKTTFATPKDFTAKFPKYIYRDGRSRETVQWREAALDMANDRAKLVAMVATYADDPNSPAFALLRELGEM